MLNLDTHVLLFALLGQLTPKERKLLHGAPWSISRIVLWEIAKLTQLGRIQTDLADPALARALSALHVWPITREIPKRSLSVRRGDVRLTLGKAWSCRPDAPRLTNKWELAEKQFQSAWSRSGAKT